MDMCSVCDKFVYMKINKCDICECLLCLECADIAFKDNVLKMGFDDYCVMVCCSIKCAYTCMFTYHNGLFDVCSKNSTYCASALVKYDQHEQWNFLERKKLIQHTNPLLNHILIDDLTHIVFDYIYNYF